MEKDYSKRGEFETATHRLFAEYFMDESRWSPEKAMVANVFKAMHYAALTIDNVNRIGNAMASTEGVDLYGALCQLRWDKVIRTRRERGVVFFEVNY